MSAIGPTGTPKPLFLSSVPESRYRAILNVAEGMANGDEGFFTRPIAEALALQMLELIDGAELPGDHTVSINADWWREIVDRLRSPASIHPSELVREIRAVLGAL